MSERRSGFSLVELMIAVAIIAILASVAFPSYTRYVQQTRRAAVMANMGEMAQWLERWYSKNNQYPSTDNANEAAALSSATNAASTTWYNVAIAFTQTNGRNTDYTITATAQSNQSADSDSGTSCATLQVTALGNQTPADCWN